MANKPKILIVDDEPEWREELVTLLSGDDYDIEVAYSFEVARERLRSTRYAVIIIDLELEEDEGLRMFEGFGLLSGIQFLESLPQGQGQGQTIVFSAYGTRDLVRQAFKRGAYDFVPKQEFDEGEFLDIVQRAIELWMSHRIAATNLQLSPEEKRRYEQEVIQGFIQAKGVQSLRDLTPEEEREFRKITQRFMRGETITFDVPEDAINPWAREAGLAEQDQREERSNANNS